MCSKFRRILFNVTLGRTTFYVFHLFFIHANQTGLSNNRLAHKYTLTKKQLCAALFKSDMEWSRWLTSKMDTPIEALLWECNYSISSLQCCKPIYTYDTRRLKRSKLQRVPMRWLVEYLFRSQWMNFKLAFCVFTLEIIELHNMIEICMFDSMPITLHVSSKKWSNYRFRVGDGIVKTKWICNR